MQTRRSPRDPMEFSANGSSTTLCARIPSRASGCFSRSVDPILNHCLCGSITRKDRKLSQYRSISDEKTFRVTNQHSVINRVVHSTFFYFLTVPTRYPKAASCVCRQPLKASERRSGPANAKKHNATPSTQTIPLYQHPPRKSANHPCNIYISIPIRQMQGRPSVRRNCAHVRTRIKEALYLVEISVAGCNV